jgi:hypothetical protein
VPVQDVGASNLANGAPELEHTVHVARAGGARDVDLGNAIPVVRVAGETAGELGFRAANALHHEHLKPE